MSSSLRKVLVLLDTIRVLVLARFLKSRTVAHLCRGRWILPYLWFPCVHSVVSFCFLLGYFKNLGGNIYYKKKTWISNFCTHMNVLNIFYDLFAIPASLLSSLTQCHRSKHTHTQNRLCVNSLALSSLLIWLIRASLGHE